MAASYWHSSQYKYWKYTKPELQSIRKKLEDSERALVQQYPLPDRRLINIYINSQIAKLAKGSINLRQQAIATAHVYIKRFYTKVEIRRTNPHLVMATAVYLACKMEECPQHIRVILGEARHNWTDFPAGDTSKIGECEFGLISEMNSQLIVHHPYRDLAELQGTFGLTQDEVSLAWSVINDHYLTDLPLLCPPHVIALTAIFLAMVLRPTQSSLQLHSAGVASALQALGNPRSGPQATQGRVQKLIGWLADSNVDIEALVDCTQELISLYELWDQFNEKICKEQISRFVKGRGLDK